MTAFGKEPAAEAMREVPGEFAAEELKSKSEVMAAIAEIGGHNLLSEHGMFERPFGGSGEWLERLQSEIIDGGGKALKIAQGGKPVGVAIVDNAGTILRFYATEGKESGAFESALKQLKDTGFEHPSVKITKGSEHMRKMLLGADFHEGEESEDGELFFTKE